MVLEDLRQRLALLVLLDQGEQLILTIIVAPQSMSADEVASIVGDGQIVHGRLLGNRPHCADLHREGPDRDDPIFTGNEITRRNPSTATHIEWMIPGRL